jgi:hypothetical protein
LSGAAKSGKQSRAALPKARSKMSKPGLES